MASFFQTPLQNFSVFVNNVPPNIHWRWLKQIFQHHGNVTDVFIPQRRNRSGRKFGFVRFSSLEDAKNAVEKLNGAWFLDYRLSVNFARSKERPAFWRKFDFRNEKHFTETAYKTPPTKSRFTHPHTDSISTGKNQTESKNDQELAEGDNPNFIEVETSVQDLNWLEASVIVSMKSPLEIQSLHQILSRKGFVPVSIASMGGSWALIQLDSKESLLKLITLENGWKDECFFWIKPWTKELICNERLVWLKISNLPLHAWNKGVFKQIGDYWGRFIQADVSSCKRQRLDFARILIIINKNRAVMNSFELRVNGDKFVIKLEVEDNLESGWKLHSSTIPEGSSRPVPVSVAETLLEENDVEEDHSLLVEETINRRSQGTNEPPLENEVVTTFEDICQQSYDEHVGFLNREVEYGGNFNSNFTDEILNAEATVFKNRELNFELGVLDPMNASYPPPELETSADRNEALSLAVQRIPNIAQNGDQLLQVADEIHEASEALADDSQDDREVIAGNTIRNKRFISISSLQADEVNCGKKKPNSMKRKSKKNNKKASFSRKKENNLLEYFSEATSFNDEEITDDDIRSRNRALRKEAEATLEVAKLLGLSTTANEEDIIRSLMEAEIEEMARNICREQS